MDKIYGLADRKVLLAIWQHHHIYSTLKMGAILSQLFHQTKFPVQIGLHGTGWSIRTFVGTPVPVNGRTVQVGGTMLQRQACIYPGLCAAGQYQDGA